MAQVLRSLPQPNILMVGQADSYVMQASSTAVCSSCHFQSIIAKPTSRSRMDLQVFDKADIIVKRNGYSYVEQTA